MTRCTLPGVGRVLLGFIGGALLMAVVACSESESSPSTTSGTVSDGVNASDWSSVASGETDSVSWEVQVRSSDEGRECSRLLTVPSRVPKDVLEGTCTSAGVLAKEGIVKSGATLISETRTAFTGGIAADDVTSVVFVTTEDDELEADLADGAWAMAAPTSVTFREVRVLRGDGEQSCPVLPESDLVVSQIVCGP